MHPPVHQVLGFICKSGLLGTKKTAFNLEQIKTLGANSILVNAQSRQILKESFESVINCDVWSDGGNKIGRITDCLFNLKTGELPNIYLFRVDGGIAGGVYRLPPNKI